MKHGVLKGFHPMIGIDFHQVLVPPTPLTPAPVPHNTAHILIGLWITAVYSEKIFTDSFGPTIMKGSDIGPMIPHIGSPSVLLAVEIPFSASKCHFGSSKYKCDKGTVGVSILFAVNLNLNCGTPVPTPTGTVLALATHRVDMTWGDIFAGVTNMCADFLLQAILQKLGGKAGEAVSGALGRFYAEMGAALLEHGAPTFIMAPLFRLGMSNNVLGRVFGRFGDTIAGTVIGFLTGGPMGADIGTVGGYGTDADGNPITPGGTTGGKVGGIFDNSGTQLDQITGEYVPPDQAAQDYNNSPVPVDYGHTDLGGMLFGMD